jgi:protein-tyrosine-phosphatase
MYQLKKPVVLFICSGNIFRSPVAAEILRHLDVDQELDVRSAAIKRARGSSIRDYAEDYAPATQALFERGFSIETHRSREVSPEEVRKASVVIALDEHVRRSLVSEFPDASGKIHLLSLLVGELRDVADPHDRVDKVSAYRVCTNDIEDLVTRAYPQIKSLVGLTKG